MIKTILFDFNGVIINDEPLHLRAYQDAFAEVGMDLVPEDYYSMLGNDDISFMRKTFAKKQKELTEDLLRAVLARKGVHYMKLIDAELPLFPGVIDLIKGAARKFTLGIVSMARGNEIEYVLTRSGVRDLFQVIISADQIVKCKPDPECCIKAFEHLDQWRISQGRNPLLRKHCLVIEDSPPGVMAARAAGMRTLGVTNTVGESALRAAGADFVCKDLRDLNLDALDELFDVVRHVPRPVF
jgi:beta-phosphoglucomutase